MVTKGLFARGDHIRAPCRAMIAHTGMLTLGVFEVVHPHGCHIGSSGCVCAQLLHLNRHLQDCLRCCFHPDAECFFANIYQHIF